VHVRHPATIRSLSALSAPFGRPVHSASSCPVHFAPTDPNQVVDPYPSYRELRDDCPVHFEESLGMWIVTRYDDVQEIVLDTDRFSSRGAVTTHPGPLPDQVLRVFGDGEWPLHMLTETDPPLHRPLRNLVQRAFTPRRLSSMEPLIRSYATDLVESFAGDGRADIIERYAWPLPLFVVGRMVGVPPEDIGLLHRWSTDLLMLLQATSPVEELVEHARGVSALQQYVRDALHERRRRPAKDLMSAILESWSEREIPFERIVHIPLGLIVAGHVTVTRAIGNGVERLLRHPELVASLRTQPDSWAAAAEEVLRIDAPTQGLFRHVTRDTEVGGVLLQKGARVMVHYGSANRDERRFDHPDDFDMHREGLTGAQMAFSKGPHFCVGAPLARLELPIALQTLFTLPGIRLSDGPGRRDRVFFARGFESLEVEWQTTPGSDG